MSSVKVERVIEDIHISQKIHTNQILEKFSI